MAHRLRSGARLIGRASAPGALYDLGTYPGAIFAPDRKTHVAGEVFAVEPGSRLVAELDAYEGAEIERSAPCTVRSRSRSRSPAAARGSRSSMR